jgi:hypothetical protein
VRGRRACGSGRDGRRGGFDPGGGSVVAARLRRSDRRWGRRLSGLVLVNGVNGLVQTLSAVTFLPTTLRGKVAVWGEEVTALRLGGAERVLDLGCGRVRNK